MIHSEYEVRIYSDTYSVRMPRRSHVNQHVVNDRVLAWFSMLTQKLTVRSIETPSLVHDVRDVLLNGLDALLVV